MTEPIVSTAWLAEKLAAPDADIRVVDIRGYVITKPVSPGVEEAIYRGAHEEYLQGHIPGAVYVDWTKDIIDPHDAVPAQIASPERFAEAMGSRGIGNDTLVIAADHAGGQFATRLWWALNYYGHERVAVLDGGYQRWAEEERALESGPVTVTPKTFTPVVQAEMRITAEELLRKLGQPRLQVVDARDAGQYTGAKRRGPRGGHIPGAVHLPRETFFAQGGGFPTLDELREKIRNSGLKLDDPIVAYCNGGVAATVVLHALARLGYPRKTLYDGSWNEWGLNPDLPVANPGK